MVSEKFTKIGENFEGSLNLKLDNTKLTKKLVRHSFSMRSNYVMINYANYE